MQTIRFVVFPYKPIQELEASITDAEGFFITRMVINALLCDVKLLEITELICSLTVLEFSVF